MVDAIDKKLKKVAVTEEDVCTLLQRYSATTVLAVLREIAQFPKVKIDWQLLVKKTKTGITSPREYQMLWRHLAYRQPLIENVGPEDQPLDDDSDLECELEACPPVINEAAIEASNCVKVLASGSAYESSFPNSSSVEGGVLNVNSPKVSSENLQVHKQSQAAGIFGEGLDANGATNNRKRRKPWSEEEDLELITAVQKFGEGSWAAIIKGDFKGNRNATQLAQRWNIIRKKQGTSNVRGAKTATAQLTEAQLATRHALDMAFKDKLSTGCGTVGNESAGTETAKTSASKTDLPVTNAAIPPSQPQPSPVTYATSSAKPAPVASTPKPRPQKKAAQTSVSSDPIQAAAVAAGARIASPSDAASLFKAVQSNNAVRFRAGSSLINTSAAGSSSPLPPNVHFIRTGLASSPTSGASEAAPFAADQQAKGSAIRPSVPPATVPQLPKARTTSVIATDQTNADQQIEIKISKAVNIQVSDTKPMTRVQVDSASLPQHLPNALVDKSRATPLGADVSPVKEIADVGNSEGATNRDVAANESKYGVSSAVKEAHQNILTVSVDSGAEKTEISSERFAGAEISEQANL
ncbi:uncharacterized protein LOC104905510 isoform X1 [Beta vulgaris subsp. vulgaris]|uniref:uncharacterized protein LOC104905510 isoform X1 n=1 Tax=Beta vulgaris subsp. vulgaris TaxID=3555 RepID=UPI0020371E26|nr:uncharacterized protein LOC104905510 isoform X1 [Beta vulgaris subsp. vulgaris]